MTAGTTFALACTDAHSRLAISDTLLPHRSKRTAENAHTSPGQQSYGCSMCFTRMVLDEIDWR